MLRQVIFATAPPRKNSREFLRNKEQLHSVQANRFICLRPSGAYCDVVQGPGATELPELLPTFSMRLQIFDLASRISALRTFQK